MIQDVSERRRMRRMCWFLLGLMPGLLIAEEAPRGKNVTLAGEVKPLAQVLKRLEIKADESMTDKQIVLEASDGQTTPLLSDQASRALFLDKRLQNRRIELKGRRFPGFPYLQVISFRVEDEGKLRSPEYYCDVCTISVRFPQVCPCCQGPMVLRMKPERP